VNISSVVFSGVGNILRILQKPCSSSVTCHFQPVTRISTVRKLGVTKLV